VLKNMTRALLCLVAVVCCHDSYSADQTPTLQDLRRELEALRQQVATNPSLSIQHEIENRSINRCALEQSVHTKACSLTISGLLQVWAYSIDNDTVGLLDAGQAVPGTGTAARQEEADNDSFRIRRAEIRFTFDIDEHITAHVMIDPAREATGFPSLPQNLGSRTTGDASVSFFDPCLCSGFIDDPRQIGAGTGTANRLLQDAYINYHDFVPQHDFSLGQLKRPLGGEGARDSGELDFAERAMITQPAEIRDLGLLVHGNWFDERVQYHAGVFNGAGTAFQQRSNRSDDNDAKDLLLDLRVRPFCADSDFGELEFGCSLLYGIGGEAAGHLPGTNPLNGLNRRETVHSMQYAWLSYRPGGPVRGWWLAGEWGRIRDRFAPSEVQTGIDIITSEPAPFQIDGWYVATGYHFGHTECAERFPSALRNVELAFRYERMRNLFFHDLVAQERRLDVFKTQVFTAGVNYYILGQRAKLQLNYNWVNEQDDVDNTDRQFREVQNNNVVLNLQTSF
jgi:hypothetical protein